MSKVMIVDDEAAITMQLEERLELMGYEVIGSACSGEEAVEMARGFTPDLILMDIMMPGGMDGIEAAEKIKLEMDIPVIFLTAYADDELVKRARSVEPLAYIVKPFQEKEIKACIEVGLYRDSNRRQLLEEWKRYYSILNTAREGIITTNSRGNIVSWNPASELMFGYPADEVLGRPITLIMPEQVSETYDEKLTRIGLLVEPGVEAKMFESTGIRKGGSEFPIEVSVATWDIGGDSFTTAIVSDITERRGLEVERREMEQKAQLASRLASIGEMASGIAHEINNPLVGVVGFAELMMERKDLPDDARAQLEIIYNGGQRVAGIIDRLLAFARQYKLERTVTDINQILNNTLQLYTYSLKKSNIKVVTQLDPELPGTIADAGQLQQVFLNIVINAEKEMSLAHGKGNLHIKTEIIGNKIRISFKDDGPGIAKENLDRIFDPFFTTREVGQGTGLGLSVCHGVIAEHNGRIYAESKPGRGATFIVELPVISEDRQVKKAEPVTKEPGKVAEARILVVDDEPTNLQYLNEVLTKEGHEVETVDNGGDALKMIRKGEYDLVLLDIKMPGMSGVELHRRIGETVPSLADRVVFITGDVMGEDTMKFLSSTGAPYVTKPFDSKKLKGTINRLLAG